MKRYLHVTGDRANPNSNHIPDGIGVQGFTQWHNRIVPFIVISLGDLFKQGVVLVDEWNDYGLYIRVRIDWSRRGEHFYFQSDEAMWRTEDYPRINMGLQEVVWAFLATSERWEHACKHLEPQIFLVA